MLTSVKINLRYYLNITKIKLVHFRGRFVLACVKRLGHIDHKALRLFAYMYVEQNFGDFENWSILRYNRVHNEM